MKKQLKSALLMLFFTTSGLLAEKDDSKYLQAVKVCLDNLIKYGTDTYGPVKSPIFVSILDVNSRTCPQDPLAFDEKWRVIRRERRNPAGANLLCDQATLKTMFAVSQISGDKTYSRAAKKYIDYYLKNLVDKKDLIWWGGHRHYDVYEDKMTGHLLNWHEVHGGIQIQWEILWEVNSEAVKKEIEAMWQWHVINKETGETNRHDDGQIGCDFPLTAGSIIESFAFLYTKTNDKVWLERSKLLANYFWNLRNKETNLIAERPNAGAGRFDGSAFATDISGPYCHSLLVTYRLTNENVFKEQATAYLDAYNKYGFDKESGKFWGALKLDGKPIPGPRLAASAEPEQFGNAEQYGQYEPRGYLDLWEPYILGSQFPLETAQCYAMAYQMGKDPNMLTGAKRFADWIEKTPTNTCETEISWYSEYTKTFGKEGTYAEKYGRTISFFVDMYILTNQQKYLKLAQKFADEAMKKLYTNGLFKGHPAKTYYEAVDGIGNLLYALVELDQTLKGKVRGFDRDNW
ncbi:MAG: hypothetical protein A2Y10_13750 [Planctomycetes bacterium GWF2_41_51]|nr:MAG: hypothetical protein A2Y10_13750 [Planctomycetes bacterium GWF2_41_51]